MPIPGPGTAISMTTIATEFGGTVPHSLSEYYRGGGLVPNTPGNSAIPTSGQIAMGNFYGSANRNVIDLFISANTYNYDVYTNRSPLYSAGNTDLTLTIDPGVTVGSTSTPASALLVPNAFNPGDTVTIINNGIIQGMGGGGGNGSSSTPVTGSPGGGGGNAVLLQRPTTITNNGTLAGGGGGGGGGGSARAISGATYVGLGGGGGGGAGFNGGAGGAGGGPAATPTTTAGTPGNSGTSPAGGSGGSGGTAPFSGVPKSSVVGGPGGAGGGRGASGSAGVNGSTSGLPAPSWSFGGSAGAAGSYINGSSFATFPVTGSRLGPAIP
jgi:hypothetical protein